MSNKKKNQEQSIITEALILADSFDRRFSPITLEEPRSLLPIVNVPMIDYAIEFLASSGIAKIYIFCCSHADKIEKYINDSQWINEPNLSIQIVISKTSNNVGDALREVYRQDLIEGDFVLIQGDLISNLNLSKVLKEHAERCKTNKNSIMTMVLKKASPTHASRSLEDDTIIVINKDKKLVYYENSPNSKSIELPTNLLVENNQVEVRYDLMDTRIDICNNSVLSIFAENFDYKDVRTLFIRETLESEILFNEIHTTIIEEEYAARVKDLKTYVSISKDIIRRWVYPVCIDTNLLDTSYSYYGSFIYKEKNVLLNRSTFVGKDSVIGDGTQILENSKIIASVIGRNCKIGKNVVIENSFIWEGVTIEDNCTISNSILCNDVKLLHSTSVNHGNIISYGVVIGPEINIPSQLKFCLPSSSETEPFDLGKEGKGFIWNLQDEEVETNLLWFGNNPPVVDNEEIPEWLPIEEDSSPVLNFESELREIVLNGIKNNIGIDNLIVDINSRKFAYDKTFLECAKEILFSIFDSIDPKLVNASELLKEIEFTFEEWHPLLCKYVTDLTDQCELIWFLQEFCTDSKFGSLFAHILVKWYKLGIIKSNAIFDWEDEQKTLKGKERAFLDMASQFIQKLRDPVDDDSDEGETEEGESEDESNDD